MKHVDQPDVRQARPVFDADTDPVNAIGHPHVVAPSSVGADLARLGRKARRAARHARRANR